MTTTPRALSAPSIEVTCGQLLVVGFDGLTLPEPLVNSLQRGTRGGVIIFKRNVQSLGGQVDLVQIAKLNASVAAAAPSDRPPLVAVDQEGGRVKRLGEPLMQLPPMAQLGRLRDVALVERIAQHVGKELALLGFNMNFAPVLDVASNPENPIIGDRAFGTTPDAAARGAIAFMKGLQSSGVLACGKHFPGHGDTDLDSHLALPHVRHPRTRLDEIELAPFRAAIGAGLASIMTAHVVFDAVDISVPATLCKAIVSDLLRGLLRFEGVCFSDDLFMRGICPGGGTDVDEVVRAAIAAIEAGCDVLLLAHDGDVAIAVHEALVTRARSDARFFHRCVEAHERFLRMRRATPPSATVDATGLRAVIGGREARELQRELQEALASLR